MTVQDIGDITSFKWATVTAIGPLRIKLDGDTAALLLTPEVMMDSSLLAVNDRVRVELTQRKVVIHGKAGGLVSLPAFQAKLTSTFSKSGAGSWSKIPFTAELVDNGSNYDATNSRFTAPVAGRYEFFMSMLTGEVSRGPLYSFRLNTQTLPVGPFDGGGYSTEYNSHMITRIFDLAAGDTIEAWTYNGNGVTMTLPVSYGNFFSGKLLR